MELKGITPGPRASRTGCNLETIRYYERIGLLPDPGRTGSGYRRYDRRHEQRLQFILGGRGLGFSIDHVRGLLDLVDRQAVTCAQVKSTAQAHLEAVREKIADLERLERALGATVRSCSGEQVAACPLIDTLFTYSCSRGHA